MSKTTVETSNALRVQAWEKELYEDTMKESYFMPRFSGEGRGNIMQVKSNLEGQKGDKLTFGLISRLAGAGVGAGGRIEWGWWLG